MCSSLSLGEVGSSREASVWWNDLCSLGLVGGGVGDWLEEGIRK